MTKKKNAQAKRANASQLARIAGQGGYYTDKVVPFMRQVVPKGTFSAAGTKVGLVAGSAYGPLSGLAGAGVGNYLGGKLSRILGFGDYEVRSNTLSTRGYQVPEGEDVPTFRVNGRVTSVVHREYIGDIVVPATPTAFTSRTYSINAANPAMFPWLASTAANYQQYRFNGLVFEFKTLSSDITAGGALGSVILATNYDVNDISFTNKVTMENSEYAVSAKPSRSQMHAIECDPTETANRLYYCRDASKSTTAVSDNRLYDLGNFQIATSGLPGTAGQVLGELWCTYDVSLFKPEIAGSLTGATRGIASVGVTNASFFGTTPVVSGTLYSAASRTVTFSNPGVYVVSIVLNGTVFAAPSITGSAASSGVTYASPVPGTMTVFLYQHIVTSSAPNQTVIYDWSASGTVSATNYLAVQTDGTNL